MGKLISLAITAVIGAVLAGGAVVGVVSSTVSAPKHNPATSAPVVNYGNR